MTAIARCNKTNGPMLAPLVWSQCRSYSTSAFMATTTSRQVARIRVSKLHAGSERRAQYTTITTSSK